MLRKKCIQCTLFRLSLSTLPPIVQWILRTSKCASRSSSSAACCVMDDYTHTKNHVSKCQMQPRSVCLSIHACMQVRTRPPLIMEHKRQKTGTSNVVLSMSIVMPLIMSASSVLCLCEPWGARCESDGFWSMLCTCCC